MSDVVIRVENLSKCYRIGRSVQHTTLKAALARAMAAPFKRDHASRETDIFWALRDVSFEVKQGEILGIIGKNGAGKSTLLKILSRITRPTSGQAWMKGRLGSLLEVGTGFHPELTGRENIYLNGAVLGMSQRYIDKRFDEIVAFAEVETFLDTPVKHYSSGMYMRLAFSVAAHLEPEILIVDEVLAVGDASFQKKSLNKMEDIQGSGRTVLFVSHNIQAITRLCKRTIWLQDGRIVEDGLPDYVTGLYLGSESKLNAQRTWDSPELRPGNDIVRLNAVRAIREDGNPASSFDIRKPLGVEISYEVSTPGHVLVPNFYFQTEDGVLAFITVDTESEWHKRLRPAGTYTSTVWVPGNFLSEGSMIIGIAMSTLDPVVVHFFEREAISFQVIDSLDGDSVRGSYAGPLPGAVRPRLQWSTHYEQGVVATT